MTDRARPGLVTLYRHPARKRSGSILTTPEPARTGSTTDNCNKYSYEASKKQLDISQLEQGTWNVLTFSKVSLIASIIKIAYATLNNITSTIF